jgi:pSer/pThr/pTyr-binding forkhead associated (FHA) protein
MSVPHLLCVSGGPQGKRFLIGAEGVRIGRDPTNTVQITDPEASRFHAEVTLRENGLWVQDTGSRNGVFVNDRRVTSSKSISPGDRVTIGAHVFTVELVEPEDEEHTVDLSSLMPPPSATRPLWPILVVVVALLALAAGLILSGR